jgi:hypothetical protein
MAFAALSVFEVANRDLANRFKTFEFFLGTAATSIPQSA